ncbi:S26 family signal peptidase [Novipirellula caenicola]|uniref:S26 family signal peptidase n=1 Tax=Novipirellula caenicola TaxID=1536901 RepID=UPI0031EBBD69
MSRLRVGRARTAILAGIVVFTAAGWIAAWSGFTTHSKKQIFRVSGFSMAPTLCGDHQIIRCPGCRIEMKVAAESASTLIASGRQVTCWHCGEKRKYDSAAVQGDWVAGDLVEVTPIESNAENPLRIGDMIAVDLEGQLRVKRILALPGDVVSLDERRLCVNGKRLELQLAESADNRSGTLIDVDIDRHRSISRWARATDPEFSDWLVYHPQSVYEHSRPSEIYDDYPCNVDVIRRLDPVDQLAVSLSLSVAATIDVAFYSADGTRVATRNLAANELATFSVGTSSMVGTDEPQSTISLTSKTPLAIRVRGAAAARDIVEDLRVRRSIEYRLRSRDSVAAYPLTLKQDECFIVGDNVPISVDSRDFGPLPIKSIVGVARRLTPQ